MLLFEFLFKNEKDFLQKTFLHISVIYAHYWVIHKQETEYHTWFILPNTQTRVHAHTHTYTLTSDPIS